MVLNLQFKINLEDFDLVKDICKRATDGENQPLVVISRSVLNFNKNSIFGSTHPTISSRLIPRAVEK